MSGLDKTGSSGKGAGTGRKLGKCKRRNYKSEDLQAEPKFITGKRKQKLGLGKRGNEGKTRGTGSRLGNGPCCARSKESW